MLSRRHASAFLFVSIPCIPSLHIFAALGKLISRVLSIALACWSHELAWGGCLIARTPTRAFGCARRDGESIAGIRYLAITHSPTILTRPTGVFSQLAATAANVLDIAPEAVTAVKVPYDKSANALSDYEHATETPGSPKLRGSTCTSSTYSRCASDTLRRPGCSWISAMRVCFGPPDPVRQSSQLYWLC